MRRVAVCGIWQSAPPSRTARRFTGKCIIVTLCRDGSVSQDSRSSSFARPRAGKTACATSLELCREVKE